MHAFAYLGLAIETPEVSTNEEFLIKEFMVQLQTFTTSDYLF